VSTARISVGERQRGRGEGGRKRGKESDEEGEIERGTKRKRGYGGGREGVRKWERERGWRERESEEVGEGERLIERESEGQKGVLPGDHVCVCVRVCVCDMCVTYDSHVHSYQDK